MNIASLSLILVSVCLGAIAQLLLKTGAKTVAHFDFATAAISEVGLKLALQPSILGGAACYGVSLVLWVLALSRVELSQAYPLVSIGYVITAIAAWHLWGEDLNPLRLLGISLIVLGVILVARS